jgi:nicotinamidase-related amidase
MRPTSRASRCSSSNFCVLFTAHDAYMRDYRLVVPSDWVASLTESADRFALAHMAEVTKAEVRPSAQIDFQGSSFL